MILKILVDGLIFNTTPYGGIARLYREVLPRVADRNKNIQFYILCNENDVSFLPVHKQIIPLIFHSWDHRPFRIFSKLNSWRKRVFDRKIQQLDPDIFHSTYYTLPSFSNIKTVAMVYDLIHYELPFLLPAGSKFVSRQKKVLSHADHVISISHATTERAALAFNLDRKNITTIYHGASPAFHVNSKKNQNDFRNKYTNGRPFFLYVGNIYSYKNLATLIRAFGLIRDLTDHLLLIASHSLKNMEKWYYDLAIQNRIEDRIIRLDHPDDKLLSQAYSASEAFVFPSLQEGFGFPLIEAMSCGVPVIASDIPVFREICDDGALFFDPHDHISLTKQLIDVMDPTTHKKLVDMGNERVKLFSWDNAAEKIENVFINVCNET